ncbi:unnamed protein product, partial [Mesorhabditis spiculigera]
MTTICQIDDWIEENKKDFVPPVCNKCMFAEQLKLFFVGGPNQRADYHLEEGEEVFYQRKGDMNLKVVENGVRRDLHIREGQIFLLPARVEHSPQRYENTIGFVVERTRKNTEFECVRYFVGDTTEKLFERWLHLTDVVKDLPPVIKEFKESEECRTEKPGSASFTINAPFEPIPRKLEEPIVLEEWLKSHEEQLRKGSVELYGAPHYKTSVIVYGTGSHELHALTSDELLIWLKDGSMDLVTNGKTETVSGNAMIRLNPGERAKITITSGNVITISMPTYGSN